MNPRATGGSNGQLNARGTPTRSGTVVNFAASINGLRNAASSIRGNIHAAAANAVTSIPAKPPALKPASTTPRPPAAPRATRPPASASKRNLDEHVAGHAALEPS